MIEIIRYGCIIPIAHGLNRGLWAKPLNKTILMVFKNPHLEI